eukprot:480308-Pyramimonas_sp.AAC.1
MAMRGHLRWRRPENRRPHSGLRRRNDFVAARPSDRYPQNSGGCHSSAPRMQQRTDGRGSWLPCWTCTPPPPARPPPGRQDCWGQLSGHPIWCWHCQ